MADFTLYPLNDFAKYLRLPDINSTTGNVGYLTSGSVTAFLSTTNGPTATAADATLVMSPTYVPAKQKWLLYFDASVLTVNLLNTLFASTPPYLIVQYPSGFRVYFAGEYVAERPGTVRR